MLRNTKTRLCFFFSSLLEIENCNFVDLGNSQIVKICEKIVDKIAGGTMP